MAADARAHELQAYGRPRWRARAGRGIPRATAASRSADAAPDRGGGRLAQSASIPSPRSWEIVNRGASGAPPTILGFEGMPGADRGSGRQHGVAEAGTPRPPPPSLRLKYQARGERKPALPASAGLTAKRKEATSPAIKPGMGLPFPHPPSTCSRPGCQRRPTRRRRPRPRPTPLLHSHPDDDDDDDDDPDDDLEDPASGRFRRCGGGCGDWCQRVASNRSRLIVPSAIESCTGRAGCPC